MLTGDRMTNAAAAGSITGSRARLSAVRRDRCRTVVLALVSWYPDSGRGLTPSDVRNIFKVYGTCQEGH